MKRPVHEAMMLVRGDTPNHQHLRRRLVNLVGITLVVDLVCSWVTFGVERNAPDSQIHTYGQCLFWSTTQLLTVSSQLVNPVTPGGRWLDVFMEFFGITIVAALAGSLGSFLYRRSLEMSPLHPKLNEFLERWEHRLEDRPDERPEGPASGSATPSR